MRNRQRRNVALAIVAGLGLFAIGLLGIEARALDAPDPAPSETNGTDAPRAV